MLLQLLDDVLVDPGAFCKDQVTALEVVWFKRCFSAHLYVAQALGTHMSRGANAAGIHRPYVTTFSLYSLLACLTSACIDAFSLDFLGSKLNICLAMDNFTSPKWN